MLSTLSYLFRLLLLFLYISSVYPFILQALIGPEALDALRSSKKLSEFVKYLGIPNVSLCSPNKDEKVDPMFNEDLAFGDLIMDNEEIKDDEDGDRTDVEGDFASSGSSPERKDKKTGKKPKKWPNGIVPYYISKDFNRKEKQKIANAIKEMNSKITSVHFHPVKKYERNYILIFSGKGCYAKLGMKGGPQPVSLQADGCLTKGTIQHELLHALGFRHEQSRPDRDDYIEILYDNIPKNWHKNYKRYHASQAHVLGDYDYYSALHYPLQAPMTEDKKNAFRILDADIEIQRIGSREKMSEMDILKVEELYDDEY